MKNSLLTLVSIRLVSMRVFLSKIFSNEILLVGILIWNFSGNTPAQAAGTVGGNGGDVLVCQTNGSTPTVELLDVYEARTVHNYHLEQSALENPEEIAIQWVERLKELSPRRAAWYQQEIKGFIKREVRFVTEELEDIDDHGSTIIPKGCQIKQIAIQIREDIFFKDGVTINTDLWNSLDKENKAALILHEVIYRERIEQDRELLEWFLDSRGTRIFNSLLFANKLSEFKGNIRQFNQVIKNNGFRKLEDKNGFIFIDEVVELNIKSIRQKDHYTREVELDWPISSKSKVYLKSFESFSFFTNNHFKINLDKISITTDREDLTVEGNVLSQIHKGYHFAIKTPNSRPGSIEASGYSGILVHLDNTIEINSGEARNILSAGAKYLINVSENFFKLNAEGEFEFGFISETLRTVESDGRGYHSPVTMPNDIFHGEIRSGWLFLDPQTHEPRVFRFAGNVRYPQGWRTPEDTELTGYSPDKKQAVFMDYATCLDWREKPSCRGQF